MNKYKTAKAEYVVKDENGKVVGYLTEKHVEQGEDMKLDMLGYTIEVL